jgi:hypothetical protein
MLLPPPPCPSICIPHFVAVGRCPAVRKAVQRGQSTVSSRLVANPFDITDDVGAYRDGAAVPMNQFTLLTIPARRVGSGAALQFSEDLTGFPHIRDIASLAEPSMLRPQRLPRRGTPALIRPAPCEAGRRAQFERPCR